MNSRFAIGDVVLEMTQIGKECHNDCVISQIYLQFPYFNKELAECETLYEKLMYALKNMNDWNRMPDALKEQVFKYLDQLAAVANLSEENRIAYDKAVDRYRVSRIVEEDIRREATEEGREEERLSNALKMKAKGLDYETISDITGLSIQEIEKLGIDDRRDEGKL